MREEFHALTLEIAGRHLHAKNLRKRHCAARCVLGGRKRVKGFPLAASVVEQYRMAEENPWFEAELMPVLCIRVQEVLK